MSYLNCVEYNGQQKNGLSALLKATSTGSSIFLVGSKYQTLYKSLAQSDVKALRCNASNMDDIDMESLIFHVL